MKLAIRDALNDPNVLGNALVTPSLPRWRRILGQKQTDSWATWKVFLIASRGEALTADEEIIFRKFTGDRAPPTEPSAEQVYVIGRRGGKDAANAVMAVYLSTCVEYQLSRGERGVLLVIAQNVEQAQVQLGFIRGVFESSPLLSQRIVSQTSDTISLTGNIDIAVRAASFRGRRGMTCVGIICSETAFWRYGDYSSNPDHEILNAIRPSLLTTAGPLIQISTPYSRQGELWSAYSRHFGKDGSTLVVGGRSIDFNPTLPQKEIDAAYEKDAEFAQSEYGGLFRSDISAFIDRAVVMKCVNHGVTEIGPRGGKYHGYADPCGGSVDSFCFGVTHEENECIIVDVLREWRPPLSLDSVLAEIASICKRYGISRIQGDKYAAQWVTEGFKKVGITYEHCELTTSDLFRELVPVLNTRGVLLLDNQRAIGQICSLERRTGRSGKDSIGHPGVQGAHDDMACVIAGAVYLAGTAATRRGAVMWGVIGPGMGEITWQGRGGSRAFDPSHNEAIPSQEWLRKNNKSRYGSSSVRGLI
jgi:hypothetical protein